MDIQVEHGLWTCTILALLLLVLPLDWILSAAAAALIHELSHIVAVMWTGGHVHAVKIGLGGAVITTSPMVLWKSMVCVAAGPAGSLCLLLAARYMPRMAVCGMVQGVFNLLPVWPLDGGRMVSLLANRFFSCDHAEIVCKAISQTVKLTVIAVCFWVSLAEKWGTSPVFAAGLFLARTRERKIPCKEAKLAVQ